MIGSLRSPGPVAQRVDQELYDLDRQIDWLDRVTPTRNEQRWRDFLDSGASSIAQLTYAPIDVDLEALRARLDAVAVDDVEQPTIAALLSEKRDELRQFLELLEARETSAFATISTALFGGNEPALVADAVAILNRVEDADSDERSAGAADVVAEAERVRALYREQDPDFDFAIRVLDDTDSAVAVHHGDLVVSRHLEVPESRVVPLVEHEVGVHVVTRHNGHRQPLRLFESGFAGYDRLQEGLATLCEFLAGCLPPARLRTLAARVVAADLATRRATPSEIFHHLRSEHHLDVRPAFDVAVRASRGGGLTKDAVYLDGLREVHAWISGGGDVTELFLGKFALHQRHLMSSLLDDGLLAPAALLPLCLTHDRGLERLDRAASIPLIDLYQTECTA